MSSHSSRLAAPYRTPGYVTLGSSKRTNTSHEGGSAGKKRRLVHARTQSDSDDQVSDEDDDIIPMSESQLNRHSKSAALGLSTEPDANKILNAKLERMATKNRAAQHKDNRKHPLPSQTDYRSPGTTGTPTGNGGARYIKVLWRVPQARKHKTWDGDGCLVVGSSTGNRLINAANKQAIASGFKMKSTFEPGDEFTVGAKEICIEHDISVEAYRSGDYDQPLVQTPSRPQPRRPPPPPAPVQQKEPTRQYKTPSKLAVRGQRIEAVTPQSEKTSGAAPISSVSTKSFYAKMPSDVERTTKVKPSGQFNSEIGESSKPRHDPEKKGSIVMKRPDIAHQRAFNKKSFQIVDVVVNPILAQLLRPHQIEGVRFLYEKVMGMRINEDDSSLGAILADEMGLGKTLQTITLIDMLLHQNCYLSPTRRIGAIERALIVCPLSLVRNWAREFRKFLGDKIRVQCIDDDNKIGNTINGNFEVLIIGYEKLLISHKNVANVHPKFGILICDEAHRLKNQAAKTSQMFAALPIDRRVLLTGTPIQNNLLEFHAMVDLVAPGLMGTKKTFKQLFEEPILKSRLPHCKPEVLRLGQERSEALQTVTQGILLRRTAEILAEYLPPKHELVVFCSPTPLQTKIYQKLISSEGMSEILDGAALNSLALTAIGILCKLCNTPELLVNSHASDGTAEGATTKALLSGVRKYLPTQVMNLAEMSGKLLCVTKMLQLIRQQTTDKVVLISNFTSTLDILESICRKNKFTFARLDGKTKQSDRIHHINSFNQSDQSSQFVFLLSKKAGGAGINLIGANRLILFDTDWNPSNDRQAMARIHRDGQKKHCFIYRMLIPGTMDEKIYQRQISKLSLSDSLIDDGGKSSKGKDPLSPDELRTIFTLHLDTRCLTHDQMRCNCEGNGIAGAGRSDEIDHLENDDEDVSDDDDDTPPPAKFMTASQVHATQQTQKKKAKEEDLSTLLRWAHHDCTSESSAPTKDSIINELVTRQLQKGIYTDDDQDPDQFDITKVRPGCILYVYAESSKKKQVIPKAKELEEVSELPEDDEEDDDAEEECAPEDDEDDEEDD